MDAAGRTEMTFRANNTLQSALARAERVQTHQLEVLSQSFPRTAAIFYLVFSLLSMASFGLLIWVLISLGRDFNSECDTPLKVWVIVDLGSTAAQTLIATVRYFLPQVPNQERSVRLHLTLKVLLITLILFDFSWLGVGLAWLLTTETCDETSSHLFASLVWYILWGLGITVFILVDTVGFYSIMTRMMRNGVLRTTNGAPPDTIDRFKERKFEAESPFFKENPECCICLVDFSATTEIRVTCCDHAFHKKCLQNWLKVNRTCPLCRMDLTQDSDESEDIEALTVSRSTSNETTGSAQEQTNELQEQTNELIC